VAGALPNLPEYKEALKAMVAALLRERDHLEIENLRLQVELDRYKKHYYRPRADQLQSADDLTQLLINLPTTRISELSAWFPGQRRLAQAARSTSLQKQASHLA
jgi:hypothetical protein